MTFSPFHNFAFNVKNFHHFQVKWLNFLLFDLFIAISETVVYWTFNFFIVPYLHLLENKLCCSLIANFYNFKFGLNLQPSYLILFSFLFSFFFLKYSYKKFLKLVKIKIHNSIWIREHSINYNGKKMFCQHLCYYFFIVFFFFFFLKKGHGLFDR